jgi:hypothetical protein
MNEAAAAATPLPPPPPPPLPPPLPSGPSPAQVETLLFERERRVTAELLRLAYVANLFDAELKPLAQGMEANAALLWDKYTAVSQNMVHSLARRQRCSRPAFYSQLTLPSQQDPLTEADLAALSRFGRLLYSRPSGSQLSHKAALEDCIRASTLWLHGSNDEAADAGQSSVTRASPSAHFSTTSHAPFLSWSSA